MEAIGIGDLHFDGGITKLVKNGERVICKEITKALNWGRKRGITNVFFYGDTCEHPRMSYESFRALLKLFRKNRDLSFHVILGNHDKFAEDSNAGHSLELMCDLVNMGVLKHVSIYTEPEVKNIDGANVHFMPWPCSTFRKKCLNVAHVEKKGSKSDSGREFKNDELPDGKEVAVIGHLHTRQKVKNSFYSGTTYQQNFGESQEKYFHHIVFNSVDDYEIKHIPCKPEYVLHNVVIESKADLKKIPKSEKDLVKLIVGDGANVDASSWSGLNNVVKVNAYKTSEELTIALTEDLKQGESLTIDTTDFFNAWLEERHVKPKLFKRAVQVRTRLLGR